jgi:adenine phosphoribosyltransferase
MDDADFEATLKKLMRPVKGFPNPEFTFGDITPLLANGAAFGKVIDMFAERYKDAGLVAVAAPEARGFFFGPPLAKALGVGFLPVRKKDQLPGETHKSELVKMDYGERCLEVHSEILPEGGKGKVVIIDDILATGGSALASCGILEALGMTIHEVAVVYDLSDGASLLQVQAVLADKGYRTFSLARFCDDRVEGSMTWWRERGGDDEVVVSPHMGKLNKQH